MKGGRMFLTLLGVTFLISALVSVVVIVAFDNPMRVIMQRIIGDEISSAWVRYLKFALLVTGISSGVRIFELEKYITPPETKDAVVVVLTRDRWVLEVYRTIIEALEGLAWVLLVFFVIALLAFVIVRIFEMRKARTVSS